MSGERLEFIPKSELELEQLNDDELVAYLVAARDADAQEAVVTATGVLVFRRYEVQFLLIRGKVGTDHEAEEILAAVFESALRSPFKGSHTGEFFALLNIIRKRRVADFHQKKNSEGDQQQPADDDDIFSGVAGPDDPEGEVVALVLLQELLAEESERDRMVIEMKIDGHVAKQIAERVNEEFPDLDPPMTFENVDQIFSRFKRRARPLLLGEKGDSA
jgi:hypothetical protein